MRDLTPDPNVTLMEFPALVPISAIGLRVDGLAQAIAECVTTVVNDFDHGTIEMKASKTGKYLSVRFTVRVTSKEHLVALDTALNGHPLVIRVI